MPPLTACLLLLCAVQASPSALGNDTGDPTLSPTAQATQSPSSGLREEMDILLSLFDNVSRESLDWDPSLPNAPCNWTGVHCSFGRVGIVQVQFRALTGSLNDNIKDLTQLAELSVQGNRLEGSVPTLPNTLRFADFADNSFSGTLAASSLPENLQNLDLSHNLLSGTLPPTIARMGQLSRLSIAGNMFSDVGPFAESIAGTPLNLLREVHLQNNALTGTFPSALTELNLTQLDVTDNKLSGTLPAQPVWLQSVSWLFLAGNSFEGPAPDIYYMARLGNLTEVTLSGNKWSCPLASNVSSQVWWDKASTTCDSARESLWMLGTFIVIACLYAILLLALLRRWMLRRAREKSMVAAGTRGQTLTDYTESETDFTDGIGIAPDRGRPPVAASPTLAAADPVPIDGRRHSSACVLAASPADNTLPRCGSQRVGVSTHSFPKPFGIPKGPTSDPTVSMFGPLAVSIFSDRERREPHSPDQSTSNISPHVQSGQAAQQQAQRVRLTSFVPYRTSSPGSPTAQPSPARSS